MKAGREHRVPLNEAALAVLREAGKLKLDGADGFVFPGMKGGGLSNMAMLVLLRRMKRGDLTAHGFRSTSCAASARSGSRAASRSPTCIRPDHGYGPRRRASPCSTGMAPCSAAKTARSDLACFPGVGPWQAPASPPGAAAVGSAACQHGFKDASNDPDLVGCSATT